MPWVSELSVPEREDGPKGVVTVPGLYNISGSVVAKSRSRPQKYGFPTPQKKPAIFALCSMRNEYLFHFS
jgi:hypothetical protein